MFAACLAGFLSGLSLIAAIGAQNAFVLRQGLKREHVGLVVVLCAGSDAVLIIAGVAGFSVAAERAPWLMPVMLWGGVVFLLGYGALRFRAAWQGAEALTAGAGAPATARRVVLTVLALTWLNPHVYLDTVVLLGSVSAQSDNRLHFGLGATTASFVFFFGLGYGARLLAPLFARPRAWQMLDTLVGLTMWALAVKLVAM